jgi:aerobic-type carbon monoxide dehydrogenase small subunit (CoxS/CutS family)
VRFTLNGEAVEVAAEPTEVLLDVVRRSACTAPKEGCWIGVCGACTVIVDDLPVSACLYLAGMAEGAAVWTAEGLTARDPGLVDAFADAAALQCGFCTPGQVTTAWWVVNRPDTAGRGGSDSNNDRDGSGGSGSSDGSGERDGSDRADAADELTALMAGNLCRCTGYQAIRSAVEAYRAAR